MPQDSLKSVRPFRGCLGNRSVFILDPLLLNWAIISKTTCPGMLVLGNGPFE